MYAGKRWRMRVDEFALVRGATEPVTSKQTAERVWEPKFLAEIVAGGDPTREARHSAEASGGSDALPTSSTATARTTSRRKAYAIRSRSRGGSKR